MVSVISGHEPGAGRGLGEAGARLLLAVLAADLGVVALHLLNELSGAELQMLALDAEHNLPTWLNSIQYFCVAAGAALAATGRSSRRAWAWAGVAALFALFSLDEAVMLHEELVERLAGNAADPVWYWPLVASPVFAAALFCLAVACADIRRELGSLTPVLAGLACLGAALILEAIGAKITGHWVYDLEVVAEEGLELGGSALLLTVTLTLGARRLAPMPRRDGADAP